MTRMPRWSVSKYKLYKSCPHAFYLKVIEKEPEFISDVAEKGKATHDALENIIKAMVANNKQALKPKEITQLITDACVKNLTPGLHPKKTVQDVNNMVKTALSKIDLANFDLVVPEKKFIIPLDDNHTLEGRIDLQLGTPDLVYLWDYKIGAPYDAEGDIQLGTYAAAVRDEGFDGGILAALFFLGHDELLPYFFPNEESDRVLNLHRQAVLEVERRLAIGKEAFEATPGAQCDYCSYALYCPAGNEVFLENLDVTKASQVERKKIAESARVAARKTELLMQMVRQICEETPEGNFEVNDGYFGKTYKESSQYRLGQVLDKLKEFDADDSVFRNIILSSNDLTSYLTSKKHKEAGVTEALKEIAEITKRSQFGFHKGTPRKDEKTETSEDVA